MFDLFNKKFECTHENITPDMDESYCPDCGKLIKNEWYISRCGCCGVKQKTVFVRGVVQAQNNFCKNCGNNNFILEKVFKINFIDIHYAVLVKKVLLNKNKGFIQTWVDDEFAPQKMISEKSF